MSKNLPDHHLARLERARLSLEGLAIGDAFGEMLAYNCSSARQRVERGLMGGPWFHTDDTENRHEKGRAHVIVFNWDRAATVSVDLSGVLSPGQRFRVVSAQNFHGSTVLGGAYAGPFELPMKPIAPAQLVGMPDAKLPVTEPEFAVFVVLPERTP